MKYYLFFTLAFGAILGWNVFLIQRDNKMFDAYKHRQQQMCEQLKEFYKSIFPKLNAITQTSMIIYYLLLLSLIERS